MIDDQTYLRLRRRFRDSGRLDDPELFDLLRRLVSMLAFQRALPPAYSPTGRWDAEAAEEALAGWVSRRLVGTNALAQAFDHASAARPFVRSLERNFRHYLQNERERGEVDNLLSRTARLLQDDPRFKEWIPRRAGGESWWGLAGHEPPKSWGGSDDELVAIAWSIGEVVLWRYSSSVGRASPILSSEELRRFLVELFERVTALLTLQHLAVIFRRRFDLDESAAVTLDEEHDQLEDEPEPVRDGDALRGAAIAVLAELTERQTEVLFRKWREESLDEIATELGISRGTVDNELVRAGAVIDRYTVDFTREEILEKVLDALS